MKRLGLGVLAVLSGSVLAAQPTPYDLVISNGRIVDGTGAPWYRGDVAVRGDTIVQVAAAVEPGGAAVIDAGGHVVAPGFIDIHTHAQRGIFEVPTADNYVRQGVTRLIEGPDGGSPVPLAPFLAKLDALRKSVNILLARHRERSGGICERGHDSGQARHVLYGPGKGSRFQVLGSRFSVLGSRFSVLGSRFPVPGSEPGTWNLEPGTWNLEPGTLEP